MMFAGRRDYSVDDKGRVVMPSKFRDALSGDLMIFKDINNKCINVYPYDEYEKYVKTLFDPDIIDENTELILDRAVSRAEVVQLDKQGRIMIPQKMRDSVGIDKEVVILGRIKKFEIWTEAEYDAKYENEKAVQSAYKELMDTKKELKMRGLK